MSRRLYFASLALTPVVLVAREGFHAGGTVLFVLAAAALVPLAYLIGEATENLAEHTGAGIGGFLNASFGNAPELIIALFAVGDGLPNVVRGSITGSVVGNLLLVLGAAMIFGGEREIDRRSLLLQVAMVAVAIALFLVPAVAGWHGSPDRHSLYLLSLPVSVVLLVLYVVLTAGNLRTHHAEHVTEASEAAWSLRGALLALGAATVATAFVSEELVHSLDAFGRALGLSQFFVAVVIVAIVGNAAEHGGAIVVARRGNPGLGAEIAISSSAQIAVFVAPAIALLSGLVGHGLPLSFRPVEIGAMGGAALVVALALTDGRSKRWEGVLLTLLYVAAVVGFALSGDR